jgi:hypothetical protein
MTLRASATVLLLACAPPPTAAAWDPPPPPSQPLPFSHKVHVADNLMGCTSCHTHAERSGVAGIPSVARCGGCHKFVKQDPERPQLTERLKPLLAKLREVPPTPIPWVRVHRVPDHVRFDHGPHARAGVKCAECHGEVEKMDEARQVRTLLMGWCVDCHRRKQAEKPLELARITDCLACHK